MAVTKIVIVSTGQDFTMPGTTWTASTIATQFASSVNGIGNMAATEETDAEGNKTITFRPRTGSKG